MSHEFYKVRKNQLTLILEPDAVSQTQPPGNYLIFGGKSTLANRFMICSVDQPRKSIGEWENYFMNDNIKVVEIFDMDMEGEVIDPGRTFIGVIFEKVIS